MKLFNNNNLTWFKDIEACFGDNDIEAIKVSHRIHLGAYDDVVKHANTIMKLINDGTIGGEKEEILSKFKDWKRNGFAIGVFSSKEVTDKVTYSDDGKPPRIRKNLADLTDEEVETLKKAFKGIQARDLDHTAKDSYFTLAGVHWYPSHPSGDDYNPRAVGLYCHHHIPRYNPWHRAYIYEFENALRSVEGCEDVTLPYWDFGNIVKGPTDKDGNLELTEKQIEDFFPNLLNEAPFNTYKFPLDVATENEIKDELKNEIGHFLRKRVTDAIATAVDLIMTGERAEEIRKAIDKETAKRVAVENEKRRAEGKEKLSDKEIKEIREEVKTECIKELKDKYKEKHGDELKEKFKKEVEKEVKDRFETKKNLKKGYETKRNLSEDILKEYINLSVPKKIKTAAEAQSWEDFHGFSKQREGAAIIGAHDSGHNAIGETMGDQSISSFDPIFWFFHCNHDRLWWRWQQGSKDGRKDYAVTIESLKATMHSSHSKAILEDDLLKTLDPFSLKTTDLINSKKDLKVEYIHPDSDDNYFPAKNATPKPRMLGSTFKQTDLIFDTENVSIRIKGVNRLKIPGSFNIYLKAKNHDKDEGKTIEVLSFFQPNQMGVCENCVANAVVNFDFVVPFSDIKGKGLSVEVKSADGSRDYSDALEDVTINARLLAIQH